MNQILAPLLGGRKGRSVSTSQGLKGSESPCMESNECLTFLTDSTYTAKPETVVWGTRLRADDSKLPVTNTLGQRNLATLKAHAFKCEHIKIIPAIKAIVIVRIS